MTVRELIIKLEELEDLTGYKDDYTAMQVYDGPDAYALEEVKSVRIDNDRQIVIIDREL